MTQEIYWIIIISVLVVLVAVIIAILFDDYLEEKNGDWTIKQERSCSNCKYMKEFGYSNLCVNIYCGTKITEDISIFSCDKWETKDD